MAPVPYVPCDEGGITVVIPCDVVLESNSIWNVVVGCYDHVFSVRHGSAKVWQERCGRGKTRGAVCVARARASELVACLRSGYLLEDTE